MADLREPRPLMPEPRHLDSTYVPSLISKTHVPSLISKTHVPSLISKTHEIKKKEEKAVYETPKGTKETLLRDGLEALKMLPTDDIPPAAKELMACDLPFDIPPIKVANVMATAYLTRTSLKITTPLGPLPKVKPKLKPKPAKHKVKPPPPPEPVFDLVTLYTHLRNSEYTPKTGRNKGFPATMVRMGVVKGSRMTSFSIFEKGVVNINGALRSAADAFLAVKRIIQLLRKLYPDVDLVSWSITNVYANARLPLAVHIDRLAQLPIDLRQARPPLPADHPLHQIVPTLLFDYNPENFPGIKIWFEPRKGTWTKRGRGKGRYATLFVNGHLNLTGNKSVNDAWLSYLTLVRIFSYAFYLWIKAPPQVLNSKPPAKAKRSSSAEDHPDDSNETKD